MKLMALRFIFALMKRFFRHDICCHVYGVFPTYHSGMQTHFNRVTIFIALKNAWLVLLIFQRGGTLRESFYVGRFHFALYQVLPHVDVGRYVVSLSDLAYRVSFLAVDSAVECGARSNVDFVQFIWRTFEAQYEFRQHAITMLVHGMLGSKTAAPGSGNSRGGELMITICVTFQTR